MAMQLSKQGGVMKSTMHDKDFLKWTEQQSAALRAGNLSGLDSDGLIEELDDMGNELKAALQSLMRNILIHLLKLQFSPSQSTRAGWIEEIGEWRDQIETLLEDTPSLKHYSQDRYEKAWMQARRRASKTFSDYKEKVSVPSECPYSIEKVLDPDFLPKHKSLEMNRSSSFDR